MKHSSARIWLWGSSPIRCFMQDLCFLLYHSCGRLLIHFSDITFPLSASMQLSCLVPFNQWQWLLTLWWGMFLNPSASAPAPAHLQWMPWSLTKPCSSDVSTQDVWEITPFLADSGLSSRSGGPETSCLAMPALGVFLVKVGTVAKADPSKIHAPSGRGEACLPPALCLMRRLREGGWASRGSIAPEKEPSGQSTSRSWRPRYSEREASTGPPSAPRAGVAAAFGMNTATWAPVGSAGSLPTGRDSIGERTSLGWSLPLAERQAGGNVYPTSKYGPWLSTQGPGTWLPSSRGMHCSVGTGTSTSSTLLPKLQHLAGEPRTTVMTQDAAPGKTSGFDGLLGFMSASSPSMSTAQKVTESVQLEYSCKQDSTSERLQSPDSCFQIEFVRKQILLTSVRLLNMLSYFHLNKEYLQRGLTHTQ